MSEEQDSLPVLGPPPSLHLQEPEGLTCSEFSGYSCRTARAPRTCKQQKHHPPTNIPCAQGPTLLHSLFTQYLKPH